MGAPLLSHVDRVVYLGSVGRDLLGLCCFSPLAVFLAHLSRVVAPGVELELRRRLLHPGDVLDYLTPTGDRVEVTSRLRLRATSCCTHGEEVDNEACNHKSSRL